MPIGNAPWSRRGVWGAAIFLLLLAVAVQAWVVTHSSLPALDAVGFVWHAQAIDRDGLLATLRQETAPPLHPALIDWLHAYVSPVGQAWSWGLCAQLAAALPVVWCPFALYMLGRTWVGDAGAFAGAVCLAWITELARLGGDGLGDGAAVLGWIVALGCAAPWMRNDGPERSQHHGLACCGATVGLALTARSEILILWLALLLMIVVRRLRHGSSMGPALAWLHAGLLAIVTAYLALCQPTSASDALRHLIVQQGASERTPLNVSFATEPADPVALPPLLADGTAPEFGRKDYSTSSRFHGLLATLREFVFEFGQAAHLLLVLAGLGAWASRTKLEGALRGYTLVAALFVGAALFVAHRGGYLSGRHLLPMVVMLAPWAGLGVVLLAHQLRCWTPSWSARASYTLAVSVVAIVCGSTTVRPLHANRVALRQAAEWLRQQPDRSTVLDSYGTTALYTLRKTYRYDDAPSALADPLLGYVVVEADELQRDSRRGATMRAVLDRYAKRAAQFSPGELRGPTVLIYRWSAERFALATGDHDARKR